MPKSEKAGDGEATRAATAPLRDREAFEDSEGLRALLLRLHRAGPGAWRFDPEAGALMTFAARRYARLAAKHDLRPEDAAVAAFEAMLNESTRTAANPWAVITWAVRITLIAEARANGLLTSTTRARRPEYSSFHDAQRFSDHDADLTEFHPAFHVPGDQAPAKGTDAPTEQAAGAAVELFRLLGWNASTVTSAVEYVYSRLPDFGDRISAYESMRRDKTARVLLDLPHHSWIGLLRIILGNPSDASPRGRRGILARLLTGETIPDLLEDRHVVRTAVAARPDRATTVEEAR